MQVNSQPYAVHPYKKVERRIKAGKWLLRIRIGTNPRGLVTFVFTPSSSRKEDSHCSFFCELRAFSESVIISTPSAYHVKYAWLTGWSNDWLSLSLYYRPGQTDNTRTHNHTHEEKYGKFIQRFWNIRSWSITVFMSLWTFGISESEHSIILRWSRGI